MGVGGLPDGTIVQIWRSSGFIIQDGFGWLRLHGETHYSAIKHPDWLFGGFLAGAVAMTIYRKVKAGLVRPTYSGPVPPVIPAPVPKRRLSQSPANWRN